MELAKFAKERFPLLTAVVLSGDPAPKFPAITCFFAKAYQAQELLAAS